MEALHLITVGFRDRRKGLRRIFQLAEIVPAFKGEEFKPFINVLYRWNPVKDNMLKVKRSIRILDELKLHTGMTDHEFKRDLREKTDILKWMLNKNIRTVDGIGKVVVEYYFDPDRVLKVVKKNENPSVLVPLSLLKV